MQLVLAVVTESPYREAVLEFAGDFANVMDANLWTLMLAPRHSTDDVEAVAEAEGLSLAAEEAVEERVEEQVGRDDAEARPPHRVIRAVGSPIQNALRELAHCDFGVVGKALHEVPTGGGAIGGDVDRLKKSSTKPLVIVPTEVRPIKRVLFVYTEHPESGHALSLAGPLGRKGVAIKLVALIPPLGRTELLGTGAGYLQAHNVPHEIVEADCENCTAEGGPVGEVLHLVKQEGIDLIVMGGTRRGLIGRLMWPEMAREVAWNADVPVLIWQ